MKLVKDTDNKNQNKQISDKEAEEAFKTILSWIGENPNREGLLETPKRVVKAFKEYFKGYKEDPNQILDKTFGDVDGYDDMVIQKNISIQSHCEHHMAPIIGKAHVAYIPSLQGRVIGLSKLNRIVEYYARRPQIQEGLTIQIHSAINDICEKNAGVAVVISATHTCACLRGVKHDGCVMKTSKLSGSFYDDEKTRAEFYHFVQTM